MFVLLCFVLFFFFLIFGHQIQTREAGNSNKRSKGWIAPSVEKWGDTAVCIILPRNWHSMHITLYPSKYGISDVWVTWERIFQRVVFEWLFVSGKAQVLFVEPLVFNIHMLRSYKDAYTTRLADSSLINYSHWITRLSVVRITSVLTVSVTGVLFLKRQTRFAFFIHLLKFSWLIETYLLKRNVFQKWDWNCLQQDEANSGREWKRINTFLCGEDEFHWKKLKIFFLIMCYV